MSIAPTASGKRSSAVLWLHDAEALSTLKRDAEALAKAGSSRSRDETIEAPPCRSNLVSDYTTLRGYLKAHPVGG